MASCGKESMADPVDGLKTRLADLSLHSYSNLATIASEMGVERTRFELIPALKNVFDDHQNLLEMAEQLGNLTEQVGGPAFSHCLLVPLEYLSGVREPDVRVKALESLKNVSLLHSVADLKVYFIPLVNRLKIDHSSYRRASACDLISIAYARVPATIRSELRTNFSELCQDDESRVRQAAARNLGDFAKVVESEFLQSDIIPLLVHLQQDKEDWVRVCTVAASVSIAFLLPQENREQFVMPLVKQYVADESWRVRCTFTNYFMDFKKALGSANTTEELVFAFKTLLADNDDDVREAAVNKIVEFCLCLHPSEQETTIIHTILPCLKQLVVDLNQGIRSVLASSTVGLFPIFGKDKTIEHLLPLFLALMKDEFEDVKLSITSNLDSLNDVIGTQHFSTFMLPVIRELVTERNWRVRRAVFQTLPLFEIEMWQQGSNGGLREILVGFLNDPVFANREAATTTLEELVQKLGSAWTETVIIPIIGTLSHYSNYKIRLTSLFCINVLADVCGQDTLKKTFPIVAKLAYDKVANVRLNVAKTIQKMGSVLDRTVLVRLSPLLEALEEDSDDDVRYFANEATNGLGFKN
ncbi:Serine/threonine-protein phosphatase 2A 65 kDa regulatory subunit A alpha isoform [Orchesella cincta]|uniref:Serine/threonine-protein phosphatase 2A 65 kDa regulatory subunit A alpha isoform n=1 Tax=Orchesella cincta TaxID=48709 RepID=A0A1D2MSU3_ORCCI|nr:Serine/threonine-protein phosphatase 2A 65 kDa regulatory subunit A alpha isoform [Orchesella cincta]